MRHIFILTAIMVVGVSSHEVERRQAKFVDDSGEKRVVCYYTNWSVYRKGLAKYTPKNINPYLCTHLIYAFGGLTDEFEVTTFDSYQDIEQGGYSQFNGLKQYNKDMKTLLALGGWNEGSARFSELVSLKEYRENFTLSAIRHLRRYNFDGLDLDWEYPASRDGSTPEDKPNYATLVMELREAFETEAAKSSKPRLLLTMAVPAGQNTIDKGYDVPTLNRYLDFFNLLTYDYHSIYEPSVNHHSALLPPPGISEYEVNYQLNVDWTIRYYVSKGASMNKLVLGIPTYGRSYTLLDADFFTMESSADGPGTKGNYTNEKGYLAFYEICEAVSLDGWEVRKPYPKRIGPFAFKGNQWVGYDDEKIAIRKSEYVLANGLGGIMFWTLDSDDFRGLCNGRQYPLIEAAKAALYKTSPTAANEARSLGDSADRNTISNLLSSQKSQQQKTDTTTAEAPSKRRRPGRRRPGSQTAVSIDPLNTPEPPTTPSSVKAFNCKREGFYPNPDDCKKYYWCLSSGTSGLGIVAHSFTCPSDLIFSKKIDGCDHPDRVKCKIGPSRGKAKAPPTTTPIPTTTEFEYLLEDLDYYYDYDFADTQLKPVQENVRIENFLEKNIIKPIRSGGANQFLDRIKPKTEKPQTPAPEILPKTPPKQPKPEPKQEVVRSRTPLQRPKPEAKQEVVRSRTPPQRPKPQPKQEVVRSRTPPQRPAVKERPQYSSIQRDRSRVREESIVEEQPVVESEVPSSPSQRPQYVTLNRKRPTSGDVVNDPLEQDYLDFIEPTPESVDSLTYITLQRSRDISTEPSVFHEGEATTAGLEYVTLRRKRPTKVPELDYEYEYLNEELDTATATPKETTTLSTTSTTTATTPKVNIRLPPRIRGRPRPSPRPRPNPPERPDPKEAAEKNDDKEDRISRFRGRINSQLEEKKYERVNRLTRLRGRLTPKPVETNEPEERVARPTRPRQKRPGLQPTEPEEEEAVVRPTRLRGRPTPKTTQPEKEVLERPTRPRGRPTSQLEEAKEQETADPPTSIREKPTSQITKPLEQDTTKEPAEVKKEPTAPLRKQKAQDVDHSIQTTERPSPETIAERLEEEIVVTEVPTESPQVVSKLPPIELSVAPIQDERVDEIIPKPIESKPAEMDANVQPLEKSVYTTDPPIEIEIKPKEIFEAKEEEKTVSSSHDGESLIEETLLLFSQNKPSQETEPSQPETRVRPFLERRKNPSSSRKLEPNIGLKEEPDTATIPVSPKLRPLPVRLLGNSVPSLSPVETFSNSLHVEDHASALSPGDQDEISQDSPKTHFRASTNTQHFLPTEYTPEQHASSLFTDKLNNQNILTIPLTKGAINISSLDDLKSIYYQINNQTLNLRPTLDNIELTQADLEDITYLYSKLIEIEGNLGIVSSILGKFKSSDKADFRSAIDEYSSQIDNVSFNSSDISGNLIEPKFMDTQASASDVIINNQNTFDISKKDNHAILKPTINFSTEKTNKTAWQPLGNSEILPFRENLPEAEVGRERTRTKSPTTEEEVPVTELTITSILPAKKIRMDTVFVPSIPETFVKPKGGPKDESLKIPEIPLEENFEFGSKTLKSQLQNESSYDELATEPPVIIQDVSGINLKGEGFRLRKLRTRVVASPVKVVVGEQQFEIPFSKNMNVHDKTDTKSVAGFGSFSSFNFSDSASSQSGLIEKESQFLKEKNFGTQSSFKNDLSPKRVHSNSNFPAIGEGVSKDLQIDFIFPSNESQTNTQRVTQNKNTFISDLQTDLVFSKEKPPQSNNYSKIQQEQRFGLTDQTDSPFSDKSLGSFQLVTDSILISNESKIRMELAGGASLGNVDDVLEMKKSKHSSLDPLAGLNKKSNDSSTVLESPITHKIDDFIESLKSIRLVPTEPALITPEDIFSGVETSTIAEEYTQQDYYIPEDVTPAIFEQEETVTEHHALHQNIDDRYLNKTDGKRDSGNHMTMKNHGNFASQTIAPFEDTFIVDQKLHSSKMNKANGMSGDSFREISEVTDEKGLGEFAIQEDIDDETGLLSYTLDRNANEQPQPSSSREFVRPSPMAITTENSFEFADAVTEPNLLKFASPTENPELKVIFPLKPISVDRLYESNDGQRNKMTVDENDRAVPFNFQSNPIIHVHNARLPTNDNFNMFALRKDKDNFVIPEIIGRDSFSQSNLPISLKESQTKLPNSFQDVDSHTNTGLTDSHSQIQFNADILPATITLKTNQSARNDISAVQEDSHDFLDVHENATLANPGGILHARVLQAPQVKLLEKDEQIAIKSLSLNGSSLFEDNPVHRNKSARNQTEASFQKEDKTFSQKTEEERTVFSHEDKVATPNTLKSLQSPLREGQEQTLSNSGMQKYLSSRGKIGSKASRGRSRARGHRRRFQRKGNNRSTRRPSTSGTGRLVLRRKILGGVNDTSVTVFAYPFVYGDGQVHLLD